MFAIFGHFLVDVLDDLNDLVHGISDIFFVLFRVGLANLVNIASTATLLFRKLKLLIPDNLALLWGHVIVCGAVHFRNH